MTTPRTSPNATHHFTVSDGITTIGITSTNSAGEPTATAIRLSNYQRSTLKVNTSGGELSEDNPPFGEFSRSDWIGGIGHLNADDDATSYWMGTAWTGGGGKILPRLIPKALAFNTYNKMLSWEYKGMNYIFLESSAGARSIYMVGDRGAADSNSGALTKLNDATKSWTTNEYTGFTVRIIEGPGKGEERVCTGNSATQLTVSPAWVTTHTTATGYVILGPTLKGVSYAAFSVTPTDVCVDEVKGIVHLAFGDLAYIMDLYDSNVAGTWTVAYRYNGTAYADLLCMAGTDKIWRANSSTGTVSSAVPADYGTDLTWSTGISVGASAGYNITGLVEYDRKLQVFKADSLWQIADDKAEKITLPISTQSNINNGKKPAIMTPYLVFPVGMGLEKMVGTQVEEFSPWAKDGLPFIYNGYVNCITPVIGGLLIGTKTIPGISFAGTGTMYSCIFAYRSNGWFLLARDADAAGLGIHTMTLQTVANGITYLIYGGPEHIWYMPLPNTWDYSNDANMTSPGTWINESTKNSWIKTGWYYMGSRTRDKYVAELTLLRSGTIGAVVKWQTEANESESEDEVGAPWYTATVTWTNQKGVVTIATTGQKIRFKIELDVASPKTGWLLGYSVRYLQRVKPGRSLPMTAQIVDGWTIGLDGSRIMQDLDTVYAKIISWTGTPTPLTIRSEFAWMDNHPAVIELAGAQIVQDTADRKSILAQLTLIFTD